MDKTKQILDAYYDGIYSERETLYRLVELPGVNAAEKKAMFDWLDGKVQGKATIKAVAAAIGYSVE